MSVSCGRVIDIIEELAPRGLALPGDPIGLQLGSRGAKAEKLYFALELNDQVLEDALSFGADLVILHHTPLYFPFRDLCDENYYARLTLTLAKGGAALYTAHTNLDCAKGGVNDVLAGLLGLEDLETLELWEDGKAYPMGRIGRLPQAVSLKEYAAFAAGKLAFPCLRFVGPPGKQVRRVACLGGAGSGVMAEAKKRGADLLVTGDLRHHEALTALGMDLCLMDAGHFCTENPVMQSLADYVRQKLPEVMIRVSQIDTNPFQAVEKEC